MPSCSSDETKKPSSNAGVLTAAARVGSGSLLCRGNACSLKGDDGSAEEPIIEVAFVVDAAVVDGDDVLLIHGDKFSRLDVKARSVGRAEAMTRFKLPQGWARVDAAIRWQSDLVFINGRVWVRHSPQAGTTTEPKGFEAWPGGWSTVLGGQVAAGLTVRGGRVHLLADNLVDEYDPVSKLWTGQRSEPVVPVARSAAATPQWSLPTVRIGSGGRTRPVIDADANGWLANESSGALSFWIRPEWDDSVCSDDSRALMFVYANGSDNAARFRVAFSCDRESIYVDGQAPASSLDGQTFDTTTLTRPLERGADHHFVLLTCDESSREMPACRNANGTAITGTRVFESGTPVASLRTIYGKPGYVPVVVGANANGLQPFEGWIGGVRLWRHPVDVKTVESLRDTPVADIKGATKDRLMVHLQGEPPAGGGATATLTLREPPADPSGGAWVTSNAATTPQVPKPDAGFEARMVPEPVYAFWWEGKCTPENCSQRELVMWKVVLGNSSVETLKSSERRFVRKGAKRFEEVGGNGSLSFGTKRARAQGQPPEVTIDLDGRTTLVRPITNVEESAYTSNWGADGGANNLGTLSKGFHLRKMNPVDFLDTTGASGRIFAIDALSMRHPSRKYRWGATNSGLRLPISVYADDRKTACLGSSKTKTFTSELEVVKDATSTFGLDVMAAVQVHYNDMAQNLSKSVEQNETTVVSKDTICYGYNVAIVPAMVELTDAFREAVFRTSERCGSGFDDAGCQSALGAFVEMYGTNYANAMGFGSRLVSRLEMKREAAETFTMVREKSGYEISVSGQAQAGVNVGVASANITTNFKQGVNWGSDDKDSTRKLETEITSATKHYSMGGTGGATPEGFTHNDTNAVPIFVDMRWIDELLVPPYFTRRDITVELRSHLHRYIQEVVFDPKKMAKVSNKRFPFMPSATADELLAAAKAEEELKEFRQKEAKRLLIAVENRNLLRNSLDIKVFKKTSTTGANHPSVSAGVPKDYVLVGGGALVTYDKKKGTMLTESYPSGNAKTGYRWVATAKDHTHADPNAKITAYAVGLNNKNGLFETIVVEREGSPRRNPPANVTLPVGYTLTGGGARVVPPKGNLLLIQSRPYRRTKGWQARGTDIKGYPEDSGFTVVYAIGVKLKHPSKGGLLYSNVFSKTQAQTNRPDVRTDFLPKGFRVTGGGFDQNNARRGAGSIYITSSYPPEEPPSSWRVTGKDHIVAGAADVRALAVGLMMNVPDEPKKKDPPPTMYDAGIEVGFDRPGPALASSKTETPEACRKVCRKETRCVAFSYDQGGKTCRLMEKASNKTRRGGSFSGIMSGRLQ